MEKQTGRPGRNMFGGTVEAFDSLPSSVVQTLASIGADITLLISEDGFVRDVAYGDSKIAIFTPEAWVGKPWRETVTVECVDKIAALVDECTKLGISRPRQVNHPGPKVPDLPVEYVLQKIPGFDYLVATGTDLRKLAEIQQQLIQAQFELEREYRRIRETETRYRVIYQKIDRPILVVDGDSRKIIDANAKAAAQIHRDVSKLTGDTVTSLVRREDRDTLNEALADARQQGSAQSISVILSSQETPLTLNIEPYRENGRVNLIVSIQTEPVDNSHSHGHGPIGGEWMEAVPEALIEMDSNGVILDINDRFLDIVRILNRNQVIGRNINTWIGASNVDLQVFSSRLREEGEVRNFLTIAHDDMSTSRPVRLAATKREHEGEERITVLVSEQTQRDTQIPVKGSGYRAGNTEFSELIGRVPLKELIREAVDVIEQLCIEAALKQTENNRASAADLLGLSRQSLYMKLKRHGLESFDGTH